MKITKKNLILFCLTMTGITSYAQTSISNSGFESTTITQNDDTFPTNWINGSGFGAGITNDAYSGNYAVSVWNWYAHVQGIIANGNANWPDNGGTPISFSPTILSGFYKYIYGDNNGGKDSAIAEVMLTRYNTILSQRDTIAYGIKNLGPVNNYLPFQVNINYINTSLLPDTIIVKFISSSNGICGGNECLYLYIDDLFISNPTGMERTIEINLPLLFIYPNPAVNKIMIDLKGLDANNSEIKLINTLGQSVAFENINYFENQIEFNADNLGNGIYFIFVQTNNQRLTQKIIIQK